MSDELLQSRSDAYDRLSAALASRYRIERELGAGGMATVYLAEDLKHKRHVAVKVLKPELAAVLGAERFVQEITTTAALQHPNILPLFDSGEAGSFLYYVMPFIDGETLRTKLDREKQLGIEESVKIATDVLDALHYAHTHGVIHRDIKPENILLANGRPMVADFGIALALSAAAGGRMTETGLSLGTPHYMSPEQATAEREITARSDIYSLGCVLYEMLTGNPPHVGATAQQIIMKIVTEDAASVTKLRRSVPPNVASAVAKALEKLPADRFENAKAFSDALANPAFATMRSDARTGASAVAGDWRARLAVPALALSVLFACATLWALRRGGEPAALSRYVIDLPDSMHVSNTQWSPLAVSPDGSKLVYIGESRRLVVRSRDKLELTELAGTEGAFNPFFSHDGKRIGYMAGTAGNAEIRIVPVGGGPSTTVISAGVGGPGAAWGYDGYIYFDASGIGPLKRVRETGGPSESVSTLDSAAGELQHNWPDPLPGGRGVLVAIDRGGPGINVSATNDIAVLDLKTHTIRSLVRGVYARYAASGHILYVTTTDVLMAVPFDLKRLELAGASVPLWDNISVRRGAGGVDLAISETGTLWYGIRKAAGQREVAWRTTGGKFTPVDSGWFGDFGSIALSRDGMRAAIAITDADGEHIWVKHLEQPRGTLTKLTFERGVNVSPRWHPDDSRVLYVANPSGSRSSIGDKVRSVRADGSAQSIDLTQVRDGATVADWTPDGNGVIYERRRPAGIRDIYTMRPGTDSAGTPVLVSNFTEQRPRISPDGRWLLFAAPNSGRSEVYVRPYPNTGAALFQVSTGGGGSASWSRDGHAILYVNAANELVRATLATGRTFAVAEQHVLFSLNGISNWDVTKDDDRFIVIHDRDGSQRAKLVVVENMFQELRARAPR